MAQFNRFDICEAHLAIEQDYHHGGWLQERPSNQRRRESTDMQLHRMRFEPSSGFNGFESLDENAKDIYCELLQRYGLEPCAEAKGWMLFSWDGVVGAESHEHYDMPVVTLNHEDFSGEFAIAEDEEAAQEAASEAIADSLFAFNAGYIARYYCISDYDAAVKVHEALAQEYEGANDTIKELIEDWDDFAESTCGLDGRGHFLSPYDGEEHELINLTEELVWAIGYALELDHDEIEDLMQDGFMYQVDYALTTIAKLGYS